MSGVGPGQAYPAAPPLSARPDPGHSLSRNLLGVGIGVREYAHKSVGPVQPSTPQAHALTPYGAGLDGSSAAGAMTYRLRDGTSSDQISIGIHLNVVATGVTGVALGWGDAADGAGINIGHGTLGGNLDGDGLELIALESGVAWRNSGVSLTAGWHHIAITSWKAANFGAFFIDGRQVATTGAAYNLISSASYIVVGGQTPTGRRRNGVHGAWTVHNRFLAASEVRQLAADPFCMLRR